jgi:hypothetical protein
MIYQPRGSDESDNTEQIGQLYEVKIRRKLNIDMSNVR